jgi:hypothetical protein
VFISLNGIEDLRRVYRVETSVPTPEFASFLNHQQIPEAGLPGFIGFVVKNLL